MDTDSRYSTSVYNLYTMPWTVLAFLIFPPMGAHIWRLDETELPVLGHSEPSMGPLRGLGLLVLLCRGPPLFIYM